MTYNAIDLIIAFLAGVMFMLLMWGLMLVTP